MNGSLKDCHHTLSVRGFVLRQVAFPDVTAQVCPSLDTSWFWSMDQFLENYQEIETHVLVAKEAGQAATNCDTEAVSRGTLQSYTQLIWFKVAVYCVHEQHTRCHGIAEEN